jgi:undecaprenyl-diphosphatase
MDIAQSIIYGIVQGLGEFLPISSTAHLVLVPFLTGWEDPGLAFDVALHAGTLLAVVAFFWKDWIKIFKLVFLRNEKSEEYNKNILWLIVLATIPGALAGFFLEDYASTVFRSPEVIVFTLIFFGLLLYLLDKYAKQRKGIRKLDLKDALIIGLSQAVAIIPGVSRSGATITAGRALGFDRVSSARFSFLLSTPIIFGATMNQLPELMKTGISGAVMVGIAISAISGYLAIKYLIRFVQNSSYKVFFYYRLALALAIVSFLFWR